MSKASARPKHKKRRWIRSTLEGLIGEAVLQEELFGRGEVVGVPDSNAETHGEVESSVEDLFNSRICPLCGYGVVINISHGTRLRCLNWACGWEAKLY